MFEKVVLDKRMSNGGEIVLFKPCVDLPRSVPWLDVEVVTDKSNDGLVKIKEMAKILKVPTSWIYERTRRGQSAIPHLKLGKYVRFDPEAVIEFFKANPNAV